MVYFGLLRDRPYGARIRPGRGDLLGFVRAARRPPPRALLPRSRTQTSRGGDSWLRITPVALPPRSPKLDTLLLAVALLPSNTDRERLQLLVHGLPRVSRFKS
jgi:hypothetical protein